MDNVVKDAQGMLESTSNFDSFGLNEPDTTNSFVYGNNLDNSGNANSDASWVNRFHITGMLNTSKADTNKRKGNGQNKLDDVSFGVN